MRDMIFNRTLRLIGRKAFTRLSEVKVIIFGIGGVGSWTAEALARSGVSHITIVDADRVAVSNINRQLPALMSTVNNAKVEIMGQRMLDMDPRIAVKCMEMRYDADTASHFDLDSYDYVIDCIDSLADKALLINNATRSSATVYSSMGAALKLDPSRIRVAADISKVQGCKLAAALRHKFKKIGEYPAHKFKCVYSDEVLPNHDDAPNDETGGMTFGKVVTNGAICHITAIFGLTLASLVINDVVDKCRQEEASEADEDDE